MKNIKIKLSVIIVNHNSFKFLTGCIQSLIRNNPGKNLYELIVVDNASTDVRASLIKQKFPSVKLIISRKNLGFARANNLAIKKSRGEFILLLNPDTIVSADTLPYMLNYMDNHPQTGIATCRVELPGGRLDDACHRGFPDPLNALFHFTYLDRIFPHSRFFNGYHLGYQNMGKIHEIDSCVGAFMLVRRSAGEELDWLDEDYFWYGEDLDFCFRARKKGWQVIFIPQVKTIHYKGISSGIKNHSQRLSSADYKTRRLATRSRYQVMRIFYRKHYADIYPRWIYKLVMDGINIKEAISLIFINKFF